LLRFIAASAVLLTLSQGFEPFSNRNDRHD